MRQPFRALALIVVLIAALTGCSSAPDLPPQSPPARKAPVPTPSPPPTALPFEVIPAAALPTELAAWQELKQPPAATLSAHVGNALFILVAGQADPRSPLAIATERVDLAEGTPPVIIVTASLQPATGETDAMPFSRAYLRLDYPASRPLPRVATQLAQAAITPTTQPLALTTIPGSALPAGIPSEAGATPQSPSGVAWHEDGQLYLFVSGGVRSTGGYAVEILAAELRDGSLHVNAKLRTPAPDEAVIQTFTTPVAFARVDWSGTDVPPVILHWQ